MRIAPLVAASALAVCASVSTAAPLDALIAFDDPYLCYPARDLAALLDGMIRWEELNEPAASNDAYKGRLGSPPIPDRFRNQLGTPNLMVEGNEYRATVPLRGTWRGLPLDSLVVVEWAESERGFQLVSDATPDQVLDAANQVGFRIPAARSEYRGGEVLGVHVGVESLDGRGVLYCFSG